VFARYQIMIVANRVIASISAYRRVDFYVTLKKSWQWFGCGVSQQKALAQISQDTSITAPTAKYVFPFRSANVQ
jgi:hypothetical protein